MENKKRPKILAVSGLVMSLVMSLYGDPADIGDNKRIQKLGSADFPGGQTVSQE